MRLVAAVLVVTGLALPAGLARADDAPAPAPRRADPAHSSSRSVSRAPSSRQVSSADAR